MKKTQIVFVITLIFLIGACGQSVEDISKSVKTSMMETFDSDNDFKEYNLIVNSVDVSKIDKISYKGTASVSYNEKTYNVPIRIKIEDDVVSWESSRGAFDFIKTMIVKNSFLTGYEETSIGSAFNAFFEQASWSEFETKNKTKIVEFSGMFKTEFVWVEPTLVSRKGVNCVVQFLIKNNDSFEIRYVGTTFDVLLDNEEYAYKYYSEMKESGADFKNFAGSDEVAPSDPTGLFAQVVRMIGADPSELTVMSLNSIGQHSFYKEETNLGKLQELDGETQYLNVFLDAIYRY